MYKDVPTFECIDFIPFLDNPKSVIFQFPFLSIIFYGLISRCVILFS